MTAIGHAFRSTITRITEPTTALATDPHSVPILPAVNKSPPRARPATNSDIVKPIPARNPPPSTTGHVTPSGRLATPHRTASQLNSRMPTGFPTNSPAATARATGLVIAADSTATPAFASAKRA